MVVACVGGMSRTLIVLSSLMSVAVLPIVACVTPQPLVSLRPIDPDVIWVAGRASVQKQAGGLRVATAFEHQDGENLALRVELLNQTEGRLNLGPANVTYATCADPAALSCSVRRPVIDPEQVLTDLNQKQSIELANATNEQVLGASLLLLSVVADTASVASGKGNPTTGLHAASLAHQMDHQAARHETSSATIDAQRHVWSNVALRRNTLFPDQGYGGLVYIPVDTDARYVWLYVQTAGRVAIRFCFHQTVKEIP